MFKLIRGKIFKLGKEQTKEKKLKVTIKDLVEELLKTGWYSNFQMNSIIKSGSADREARRIRENPPVGYVFKQRPKKKVVEGQRPCLEYHLAKAGEKNE